MNIPCGREDIARLFQNCISGDKLAQAYIIRGDEGMGKKTVVNYILSLMLCREHTSSGNCLSCKSHEKGVHPDVVELRRAPDRASLGVDRVRDIKTEVYTRATMADYKAVVVYEAHLATVEAQNAMLKMIEEPPEKVVFFILCDTLAPILQTIISRSVTIELTPLSHKDLRRIFGETVEDFELSLCEGNPGRFIKLHGDGDYMSLRDKVIDLFSTLSGEDSYAPYAIVTELDKIKENKNEVWSIMLVFARDAYYRKMGLDSNIINKDKLNYIDAFSRNLSPETCWKIADNIINAYKEKGKNGNFYIAMSVLLLKCRSEINKNKRKR